MARPDTKLRFDTGWQYAPAPESTDHVRIDPQYGLFIGGEFVAPRKRRYFATINPATAKPLAQVAQADAGDVDRAVAAARRAWQRSWSKLRPAERGKYLYRIARALQERAREFAVIETLDGGKPIRESRDVDVPLAAAHFFYYAGWADKLDYAFPGRRARPLGVAGQIIPWNFPLLMAAWKIAPALACGNTVVLKPAETTPLTALKLAELMRDVGLPPGVVNIVTGAGETGAALVDHADVDKIAFTGSTEVGRLIQRRLAGTAKHYTLELGGKAANIIFADAALDQAVEGIVDGIFFNQGHVCCAGSRLLVQESVAEEVIAKLKDRMETLIVGDPIDKNTDIGAINSAAQLAKIEEYLRGAGRGRRDAPELLPRSRFRLLVPADALHRRVAIEPRRAGGDLRPGARDPDLPYVPGSARQGQQHALRSVGRRLDGQGREDLPDDARDPRRGRLGEHLQQVRPDLAVRRLQGERHGPRRRSSRSRCLRGARLMAARARKRPTGAPATSKSRSNGARARLPVAKTYKLYVDGKFPRSESGRYYPLERGGRLVANVCRASRKDFRDAVVAARNAFATWSQASAYLRGQMLYRAAEMLEGRHEQFTAELVLQGVTRSRAAAEVTATIDRLVYYAGWADKYQQVFSSVNPVATSHFNFSVLEPTGVVAIIAPEASGLLGLASNLAPAVAGGNTCVVLASKTLPLAAVSLGEVLQASDIPAGVVNMLTGWRDELAEQFASHMDVNAVVCCDAEADMSRRVQVAAADNIKRVVLRAGLDWTADDSQSPYLIRDTQETKTTWHPIGA